MFHCDGENESVLQSKAKQRHVKVSNWNILQEVGCSKGLLPALPVRLCVGTPVPSGFGVSVRDGEI